MLKLIRKVKIESSPSFLTLKYFINNEDLIFSFSFLRNVNRDVVQEIKIRLNRRNLMGISYA